MKKGVSLPINVVIIVLIGVVVLLGVIGFFSGTFTGASAGFSADANKNTACSKLHSFNCEPIDRPNSIPVDKNSNGDYSDDSYTLQNLCEEFYGCPSGDNQCCLDLCRC